MPPRWTQTSSIRSSTRSGLPRKVQGLQSSSINLFQDFFKAAHPDIKLAGDVKKNELLIEALAKSGTFATTHLSRGEIKSR